jgi:rod shape-determining protein MreD
MERLPGIRPRPSLGRVLDQVARWSFPASTTALLLLIAAAPIGLPGLGQLQMAVALACVFFWSVFRPAAMPPVAVFAIGVLTDLLGYAPPGVAVLTLLLVHGFALRWRRILARQGFLLVWLAFVGFAAVASALAWVLTSALTFQILPPGPGVLQAAVAAGVYPALSTLLTRAHQSLAAPERA